MVWKITCIQCNNKFVRTGTGKGRGYKEKLCPACWMNHSKVNSLSKYKRKKKAMKTKQTRIDAEEKLNFLKKAYGKIK